MSTHNICFYGEIWKIISIIIIKYPPYLFHWQSSRLGKNWTSPRETTWPSASTCSPSVVWTYENTVGRNQVFRSLYGPLTTLPRQRHIRIFNGCEVRIENSVMTETIRLHEASLLMPNSYLEWRNFQFAPNNHWFFFLHTLSSTIEFKFKYALFYAKMCTFFIKKCLVKLLNEVILPPLV